MGQIFKILKSWIMKESMSIFDCSIINLNQSYDKMGDISSMSNFNESPFSVKRIFYLCDIPFGKSRGAHAHKDCHQLLVAISGSFEVLIDDGKNKSQVLLNKPDFGLYIPPGIWASEVNFSNSGICLVLASHIYDESDYIRNYEAFKFYKSV